MITLTGRRISGTGMATENLKRQMPLILPEFPELNGCHYGTINLELDTALIVANPDHRTKPIPWDPSFGSGEIFDFLRIKIELDVSTRVPCWLYIAHGSVHRITPRVHEVLGPTLPVDRINEYKICIDRNFIILPYNKFRMAII